MGDLYLTGYRMVGSLVCSQGGHSLTNKLLRKIFSDKKNYVLELQKKSDGILDEIDTVGN